MDRNNQPLNISYQNNFNIFNNIPHGKIPNKLKTILIFSEDKRFYQHRGIDYLAKLNAIYINLKNTKIKRGASTISEQVVRIIHPRKRTLWSKWLEIWETIILENKLDKKDILTFYINQVPFASNRRGFQNGANFYFDKDIYNLSLKEILFLIISLQSPSNYNPYREQNFSNLENKITNLAFKLYKSEIINEFEFLEINASKLTFKKNKLEIDAKHFLLNLKKHHFNSNKYNTIKTTLDSQLQNYINSLLLANLRHFDKQNFNVKNSASLVVKRKTMEILSYNSISLNPEIDGDIDSVTTLRQPASTLKPFLYGLALENGFSLASKVIDESITQAILRGQHDFFNASHKFYGEITIREALANSLNIPAIKTLEAIGLERFFLLLKNLGFNNMLRSANYYNLGLAVGAIETNLFELVRAYSVLANNGEYKDFSFIKDDIPSLSTIIFPSKITSLITTVLTDRISRRVEFSRDSILNFPIKTAVKTGTSSDYKDAWAIGYNDDYVVGVWLGNLDYQSMNQMAGAIGPGLILRHIFSELNRYQDSPPPQINKYLIKKTIDGYDEYFLENNFEIKNIDDFQIKKIELKISYPFHKSEFSFDPRINQENQKLFFKTKKTDYFYDLQFLINGMKIDQNYWMIEKGKHVLTLRGKDRNGKLHSDEITFTCH